MDVSHPDALDPVPDLSRSIELLTLAQGGDLAALNEFFQRYQDRLERIVRVKMGARLREHMDEKDILQDVFLVASQKIQEFELRSHAGILHWLVRIAQNQINNRLKYLEAEKRNAGREVPFALDTATHGIQLAASQPTPSHQSLRAELEELVDAAIEELDPPEYREVILHRDYYQEEWEEVRQALARPTLEAVQELYRRAHRKLREKLSKHLDRE